ncbi:PQQ-binding-like beta-propeller repeat protein, partial [Actinotalea ferrariae]|uniref:outer membrane protein assembly factor BamB family protein n=1 Tax=Actinotalea ferrariae TaxID=1386098 RepID=UPI001C8BFFC7
REDAPDVAPDDARRRRRPRRGAVVLGAAVAVALVTAVGVASSQERAEAQRLAALPGFVESLGDPLTETWRAEAPGDVWTTEALLLVPRDGRVVGVDLTTGVERWAAPVEGAAADDVARCVGTTGDAAVVVCHVMAPDRLVVLDASDGSSLGVLDAGASVLGVAAIDGDVVRVTAGPAVVERLDPRTGDVRWSAALPHGAARGALAVQHGLVTFSGDVASVLDGADGTVLGEWPGTDSRVPTGVAAAFVRARPDAFGVWVEQRRRFADPTGHWFTRDGSELGVVDGYLAEPRATDHSLPSVVLTVTDAPVLRAVEVGEGPLWAARAQDGLPVVRVDGTAVLASADVLRRVDLADGGTLWSVPLDPGDAVTSVSDGRHVLVLSADLEGRRLAAVSLADGATAWSERIPGSWDLLDPEGAGTDVVLVRDGDAVVGLR